MKKNNEKTVEQQYIELKTLCYEVFFSNVENPPSNATLEEASLFLKTREVDQKLILNKVFSKV